MSGALPPILADRFKRRLMEAVRSASAAELQELCAGLKEPNYPHDGNAAIGRVVRRLYKNLQTSIHDPLELK